MRFDPEAIKHKRGMIILTWIATICALISVLYMLFKTDVIINNTKQPSFVVVGKSPHVRMDYKVKIDLPQILEPYKKQVPDTSQSIVFQLEKKINEEIVKLSPLSKINVDSIVASNISETEYVILPRLEFNLSIKNTGDRVGKIVLLIASDSLTLDDFLIKQMLNAKLKNRIIEERIPDFEKLTIQPDSIIDIKFAKISPQFLDKEKRFNVHLCIVYCDSDNNLYQLYHIVQYQERIFDFAIVPQPIYSKQSDGKWVLSEVVTHFRPYKPQFSDMYKFLNAETFMEYRFSEKEREKIIDNLGMDFNFENQ